MVEFYVNGFSSLIGDAQPEDFSPFIEARRLRRMEKIAKNVLLCSCRALAQAGVHAETPKNTGLSVAVGAGSLESTCKFMDSIIDDGDELSSPTAFAGSVHNSTGLTLSVFLHLAGPCVTTGQFDASFAGALLTAHEFLRRGLCAEVLVAVAEDINPFCAAYVPEDPALFSPVLRAPRAPFVRAAAAFLISAQPMEKTLFVINQFSFSRTDDYPAADNGAYATAAQSALTLSELLASGNPLNFTDVFGGAKMTLQGVPYVKAQ